MDTLDRFVKAQEGVYATALAEVKRGRKMTHWMWYVFPQLRGLGQSPTAHFYGVDGLKEAREYLAHPTLSARLVEISEALLGLQQSNAQQIFGHTDAIKLRSCMTLFAIISNDDSVFHKVLSRFFDGKLDERTLQMAGER